MIPYSYNPLLVVASLIVGFFSCQAAVELAVGASDRRRKFDFIATICTWGVAVWATHFVGMLAFDLNGIDEVYGLTTSALALFVAIVGAALAIYIKLSPSPFRRWGAAGVLGISITTMHMVGIKALTIHIPATDVYEIKWIGPVTLLSIIACYFAIKKVAKARAQKVERFGLTFQAALWFTLAIAITHYGLMMVTHFVPSGRSEVAEILPSVGADGQGLSTIVMLTTFIVLGAILTHSHRIHHEANEALQEAYKSALEAAGVKDDFMAVMSHELRTPLTAIMGYNELILDGCAGECNGQQRDWLERMDLSSKHLLSLIEQVLDVCRAEKGKLECQIERTDAGDLVKRTAYILKPLADKKTVSFYLNTPDERLLIETDIGKFRQVVVNLIGNAIKFTEKGSITIELSTTTTTLRLAVRDTGIGISDTDQARIFEPFYQCGVNPYNRSKEGAGLGLTISRDILLLLGGTINVYSKIGVGSTFVVVVPRIADIALVA